MVGHTLQAGHLHATAAAWESSRPQRCDLAGRDESLFLAERFRMAISSLRKCRNVCQAACESGYPFTRLDCRRCITRSTLTEPIFAIRTAAFSAGHGHNLRHVSSNRTSPICSEFAERGRLHCRRRPLSRLL